MADCCPYGIVGDRLWVKEAWAKPGEVADETEYRADNPDPLAAKWRPSIHMPRWASRITLEITDVRVQRVQEMSYNDWCADFAPNAFQREQALATFVGSENQKRMSRELWDSINAKRGFGWDANPWVWAITFKRIKP
jgi:hypothetical protein